MAINYWGAGLFIAAMVVLIIWLIKRNRKDEKVFEEELIQSELKPENDQDSNTQVK